MFGGLMYRIMDALARFLALLGGIVLLALILLTVASVLGRAINSVLFSDWVQGTSPGLAEALLATGVGPINGDFEIVEAGMAFAIFAFLPVCQLHGSHAIVDIFTSRLPQRWRRGLGMVIEVVFAAVLVLIAVQLTSGMVSKLRSGQTTLLLEFPLWWSYAASVFAAFVAALVAGYVALMRIVELSTGRDILPMGGEGAAH